MLREDEASPGSSILGWWVARYVCGGQKITGMHDCIPFEWCYKMSITPNWEGGYACAQTLAQIGREIVGCRVQQRGSSGNRKFNEGIERGNKMRRQLRYVLCVPNNQLRRM
jgi:hypothetical protein